MSRRDYGMISLSGAILSATQISGGLRVIISHQRALQGLLSVHMPGFSQINHVPLFFLFTSVFFFVRQHLVMLMEPFLREALLEVERAHFA